MSTLIPQSEDAKLPDEANLLLKISCGDEEAFCKLLHHYGNQLASFILRFTRSKEKTEELVQDIFMQIWTNRQRLGNINKFRNFLFTVSRNHALNAIRDDIRNERRRKLWIVDNVNESVAEQPAFDESDFQKIDRAIKQLPPQQQKVWLLSRKQGKKYQEIADELSLSRETVKKYIRYANLSIKEYLKQHLELFFMGTLLISHYN